jgi:hypothetical protein
MIIRLMIKFALFFHGLNFMVIIIAILKILKSLMIYGFNPPIVNI